MFAWNIRKHRRKIRFSWKFFWECQRRDYGYTYIQLSYTYVIDDINLILLEFNRKFYLSDANSKLLLSQLRSFDIVDFRSYVYTTNDIIVWSIYRNAKRISWFYIEFTLAYDKFAVNAAWGLMWNNLSRPLKSCNPNRIWKSSPRYNGYWAFY